MKRRSKAETVTIRWNDPSGRPDSKTVFAQHAAEWRDFIAATGGSNIR